MTTLKAVFDFPLTRIAVFLFVLLLCLRIVVELISMPIAAWFARPPLVGFMVAEVIQTVLVFLVFVFMVRSAEKSSISKFGISRENSLRDISLGFLSGAGMVSLMVLSLFAFGVYHVNGVRFSADFFIAFILLFFTAFSEEIVFRSYIFRVTEKSWGTLAGVLISSFLFGFAHMINEVGGASLGEKALSCLFLSFEAGFPLVACYVMTRKIWMSVGMHWAWNLFEGPVYGLLVSGTTFGVPLLSSNLSGPKYLTGGAFGLEASLSALVTGTGVGLFILYRAAKKGLWRRSGTAESITPESVTPR